MNAKRIGCLIVLIGLALLFLQLDGAQPFSFERLKDQQAALSQWHAKYPAEAALAFFAVYVSTTALSFPGATVLALLAGAVSTCGWD